MQELASDIAAPTSATGQTSYTYPTPTNDLDPIVDCQISQNCGGGVYKAYKNQCNQSVCCKIDNDKWQLEPSNKACDDAVNNYVATLNSKYQSGLVDCHLSTGTYKLTPQDCAADIKLGSDMTAINSKTQETIQGLNDLNKNAQQTVSNAYYQLNHPPITSLPTNTLPQKTCPTDWNEYFQMCPGYYPVNGVGGTPPCTCIGSQN